MTTPGHAATEVAASPSGSIVLGSEPTRLALRPNDSADLAATLAEAASRRFTLVLRGLAANRPPGTGYTVFLNVPEGATPGPQDAGLAGTVSFFGVPAATDSANPRAVSFEVSEVFQRLRAAGRLGGALSLTIVPTGQPAPDSRPTIDRITLVEE